MWQHLDPTTGPRFISWARITGQPGATAGPLLVDNEPLPVGQTLGDNGVIWAFDGVTAEALMPSGRATLSAEGVDLMPSDPESVEAVCAFCAKGEGALELYGWTRPPEGWLACGDRMVCSFACAVGAGLRLEIGVTP